MTWTDRLALRYRGMIALIRLVGELRISAAVLLLMLTSATAQPTALLFDHFPEWDLMFDVWGFEPWSER